jgi:hypothetical protein
MSITYRPDEDDTCNITVKLQHHIKHVLYIDVRMPPEALQMIQDQAEWSTPAAMSVKIQLIYSQVTTKQIHAAWRELSQQYWRRDDEQLLSAKKLLAEYGDDTDIFEPVGVPDGVEILAWGMKRIAEPLRGKVVEIGIDATCKQFLHIQRSANKQGM